MKRKIVIFGIVLIILILGYPSYWIISYYIVLRKQEKEWIKQEYHMKVIQGTIKRFETTSAEFHILDIDNKDTILTYGIFTCDKNKDFVDFLSVGDSIIKYSNSSKIKVIKKTKKYKDFDSMYCNE